MAALRVLVCSQITGLCEAVERSAAAAGCRVALQQRTPAEIERVLLSHPAVREAGVAAVADASFGQRPKAWLVVSAAAPDDAALAAFCRERLAGYKVPVAFERVSALPRNALGKLLRHRLGSPATPDSGSLTERDGGHAVSG